MSKVSKTDSADTALADLRAEFPDWTIDAPWSASRRDGSGDLLEVTESSYGALRAALDKDDAVNCRTAIGALRDALRDRGLRSEVYGLTLHTLTRTGILRVVSARRGRFIWASSGVDIGPISDPAGAVEKMLPELGLA